MSALLFLAQLSLLLLCASEQLHRVPVPQRQTDAEAEQKPPADGESDEQCRHLGVERVREAGPDQLIVKLLPTLTGPPLNAGTCAPRNLPAMHPPTGVPGNGPWSTTAEETEPLGAKVIFT